MRNTEFRAYDKNGKTLVYDRDLWLPQELKKIGLNKHPVQITPEGIHYTLDCISNHYENEWEEDVLAILDIDIMPATPVCDSTDPNQKIYANDIISFYPTSHHDGPDREKKVGRIAFCESSQDWIIVDKEDHPLAKLSEADHPVVLGNWYDHPELLA